MPDVPFDVVEQILVQLDVKDLIRYKSVCKSWQSFISSPRFVKAHLNHNIKSDRDNHQLGHRRIHTYDVRSEDTWISNNLYNIVGSSNGLVCVCNDKFLVTNPSTREDKNLQTPPNGFKKDPTRRLICWGFGYDSSSDDYKVIVGIGKELIGYYKNEISTLFYVLTLKSNTWKVIGEVKYHRMGGKTGILCDGTIYWLMANNNYPYNKVMISLDLSTEELKEIPLPNERYYMNVTYYMDAGFDDHRLGVIQDCLCIYSYHSPMSSKIRVMKNNNWELYIDDDCQHSKYDVAHCLSRAYDSRKSSFKHSEGQRVPCNGDYIRSSIFVKSLVSPNPHVDNTYEGQNKEGQGVESGAKGSIRKKKNRSKR